jgi:hypothetical protein
MSVIHCATCKKIWKWKELILANFGMLNMKMTLKTENRFWFSSYRGDLVRMRYCSADK